MGYRSITRDYKSDSCKKIRRYGIHSIKQFTRHTSGKKGLQLLTSLEQNQSAIVNRFLPRQKEKIAGYRFLQNARIKNMMLSDSLQAKCAENSDGAHIIGVQDTTEYNYQHHSKRVKTGSLGTVGNNRDMGFFSHIMICFDAHTTLPLGISYAKQWGRNPARKDKYERNYPYLPIEDKESFRWIEAAQKTKSLLSTAKHITLISDRESDIFQIWSRVPDHRTDLIIRARVDRKLFNKPTTVFNFLGNQPVMGSYSIELKGDARKRQSKRSALINVKYVDVEIRKPKLVKRLKDQEPDSLRLFVIEAKEDTQTIAPGDTPIHWVLFTTYQVTDIEQAKQIIQWYCFRWQIEQFFRITKKQGIDVESSQLESGEGLMKLVLFGFAVALKILQLSLARDGSKNDNARKYFESEELIVLGIINSQLQGATIKQKNPFPEKSLSWAAWIIARLGGYSGYKSQSPPGPITFKWGLDKFSQILEGFRLARDVYKE